MSMASDAKEAAIMEMMAGFPSSSKITDEHINAYLSAVEKCSPDAVVRSCRQFLTGKVEGHNNSFMPTAAELAANAASWDEAIAEVTASQELRKLERIIPYKIGEQPPPPAKPLGPTKLSIGGVMRDLTGWTPEEKDEAMRTGRIPDSVTKRGVDVPALRIQRFDE